MENGIPGLGLQFSMKTWQKISLRRKQVIIMDTPGIRDIRIKEVGDRIFISASTPEMIGLLILKRGKTGPIPSTSGLSGTLTFS